MYMHTTRGWLPDRMTSTLDLKFIPCGLKFRYDHELELFHVDSHCIPALQLRSFRTKVFLFPPVKFTQDVLYKSRRHEPVQKEVP